MTRLTEKEKELIEVIRNFREAKGRMEKETEFQWLIFKLLEELMYDEN